MITSLTTTVSTISHLFWRKVAQLDKFLKQLLVHVVLAVTFLELFNFFLISNNFSNQVDFIFLCLLFINNNTKQRKIKINEYILSQENF